MLEALQSKKATPKACHLARANFCTEIKRSFPQSLNVLDFIKNRELNGKNQLATLMEYEQDDWIENKETWRSFKTLGLDCYFEKWEKRNLEHLTEAFKLRMEANKMERTQIECELRNTREYNERARSFACVASIMRFRAGAREYTVGWKVDQMSARAYFSDSSSDDNDDDDNDSTRN